MEAEKRRKAEERIWIEVKTIEENKAKERAARYKGKKTEAMIQGEKRRERINRDTEELPQKLFKQFKTIKQLNKDIKKFHVDTEGLSKKFIADMEVEAKKDRMWQMKLQEKGLANWQRWEHS